MNDSTEHENPQSSDWLSRTQITGLTAVISSIYDQALLAFNRSPDNLEGHDLGAKERNVVRDAKADANLDVIDRVQHAGWNVIHRAQILTNPSRAEIEQEVQNALLRLGIPSRKRVEKISQELDELNALLDQRLAKRCATQEAAKNEE